MDNAPHPEFPPNARWLCPHAQACPGCPLIHLGYDEQLANKTAQVRNAIAPYPELSTLDVLGTRAAPRVLGYRTRAKLVASGAELGLFKRGTHEVVDIPECLVLEPRVLAVVAALRARLRPDVALQGVDVALVGEQLLVTLIASEMAEREALLSLARELQQAIPQVKGVAFVRRADEAVQLLSTGHEQLVGVSELRTQEPNAPHHYVALGAFMQAHAETSAAIYDQLAARVLQDARNAPRVLELYAGSGALSLALAQRGAELVAVESYEPACERLTRAAREQNLNVRVRNGDAGRELTALAAQGESFDVVLVNPPRRGLDPRVRAAIAKLGAKQVGYVSCKPATLARDLAHLARLGLQCAELQPFDMMPLTDQVETLAWLTRGTASTANPLFETDELLVVDKAGYEAVQGTGSLVERVAMRAGCDALIPLSSALPESSGVVLFAKHKLVAEPAFSIVFIALARGVVRTRGQLRAGAARARYTRIAVVGGHSLVRVEAARDEHVLQTFRVIGHPIIGDTRADRATAKHFAMRHGLDRTFLHAVEVGLDHEHRVRSPLAPDLAAVLASLAPTEEQASELAQSL